MIKIVLLILFPITLFAHQTPEELWQASNDDHLFMFSTTYEDYEIDTETPSTNVEGEYSTKTKIYTFDYEYGLSNNFSLGVGTTFIDSLAKYTDTNNGFERDRIKGLTDISVNFKGRHHFNKKHGLHYGIKAKISLEDKERELINTASYESNASNGRHIFTPYVSYVFNKSNWLIGIKAEQDLNLDKTITTTTNNSSVSDDSEGDAGTFVTAFYETRLDDNNWAGLLAKYSTFSDFTFKSNKRYDPSARTDNLLFQVYGNIALNEKLTFIPKAYYVKFNDKQEANNDHPNNIEVKQSNGGSFSFSAALRYKL